MPEKRTKFREGDWFAVPLREGGYALGLLARLHGKDTGLGYFFGPRRETVPGRHEVQGLQPQDAILAAIFGTPGLARGDWMVVGSSEPWVSHDWPIPVFTRKESLTNRVLKVVYGEGDLLSPTSELAAAPDEVIGFPEDVNFTKGAIEVRLTRLLSQSTST